MAWFNERKRSPNETNLAKTHNMFMSAVLFNSQNAGVHGLVYLIRYICYICCSATSPLNESAVPNEADLTKTRNMS